MLGNVAFVLTVVVIMAIAAGSCGDGRSARTDLSDADVEYLVRRSYQYLALYNVNN